MENIMQNNEMFLLRAFYKAVVLYRNTSFWLVKPEAVNKTAVKTIYHSLCDYLCQPWTCICNKFIQKMCLQRCKTAKKCIWNFCVFWNEAQTSTMFLCLLVCEYTKTAYKILIRKLKGKKPLDRSRYRGIMLLAGMKNDVRLWSGFIWLRLALVSWF